MARLRLRARHRLMCGDSTSADDVAVLMDGSLADVVFTSPPYAVGVDYGDTYQDDIASLRALLGSLSRLWREITTDDASLIINFMDVVSGAKIIGEKFVCQYPMALEYWPIFRDAGWALWSQRIWCKPIGRVAAPWCASSNRAASNWEHIWTWRRPNAATTKPTTGGAISSMHGWCDTSKMEGVDVGKATHGAGMPVSVPVWMIEIHCERGAIVHEPFAGTGTTIISCEKIDRRCRAMEISPIYVDVACRRWALYTGEQPVHEASGKKFSYEEGQKLGGECGCGKE